MARLLAYIFAPWAHQQFSFYSFSGHVTSKPDLMSLPLVTFTGHVSGHASIATSGPSEARTSRLQPSPVSAASNTHPSGVRFRRLISHCSRMHGTHACLPLARVY